ncbi:MAG: phytanoyl-CoA dioxygenase family protein [Rhodospirillaceae bacterium]|nr:phytanoyl-CoA dioxygenase family protein [Rhodospirillaceae bacterium]
MEQGIKAAIEHLDIYGYCILADRIPAAQAEDMAARFLLLHTDPRQRETAFRGHPIHYSVEYRYETLYGLHNIDDRVWECTAHPDVLAIVKHFLGPDPRAPGGGSKPSWPGCPAGNLHADDARFFHQLPDFPWLINSMWMLSDFTAENGATRIVPMSHKSGLKRPPPDLTNDSPLTVPLTGRRGSVALWHGGMFHMNGANVSNEIRMGLNIAYYPPWFNRFVTEGEEPLWPETAARMPPELRKLMRRYLK